MIRLSPGEARKFGAPYDPDFNPAELRTAAFELEDLISKSGEAVPMKSPAARYALRAMFSLADRIERET